MCWVCLGYIFFSCLLFCIGGNWFGLVGCCLLWLFWLWCWYWLDLYGMVGIGFVGLVLVVWVCLNMCGLVVVWIVFEFVVVVWLLLCVSCGLLWVVWCGGNWCMVGCFCWWLRWCGWCCFVWLFVVWFCWVFVVLLFWLVFVGLIGWFVCELCCWMRIVLWKWGLGIVFLL